MENERTALTAPLVVINDITADLALLREAIDQALAIGAAARPTARRSPRGIGGRSPQAHRNESGHGGRPRKAGARESPGGCGQPDDTRAHGGRRRRLTDAQSVLAVLGQGKGPLRAREVTVLLGLDDQNGALDAVRTMLERLAKTGRAQRTGRGLYDAVAG
ncbi:hypothetical protein ABZW30_39010 [Kitasatospora sp. NPDC004669]|uniref:hypothetical protein n=1 Tax=Kitasatospora sp. NPDC004669 TaxID=3154555 RepID=UPI0033B1FD99